MKSLSEHKLMRQVDQRIEDGRKNDESKNMHA